MNLVVGATGFLGGEICRLLAESGRPVRAMVRSSSSEDKVAALEGMGVEVVRGDVRERAALDDACKGVSAVISTISAMPFAYDPESNGIQQVDVEGVERLIDAAKAAGAQRFVYTSISDNMNLDFPLRNAKRAVERYLRDSGLTYTILRPSYFMEGWLGPTVGFDYANGKATIYGTGQNAISWIAVPDVARFAVASLDNPAAENATLELGGPDALSPDQVVSIFENIGGTKFEVTHVPEAALTAQQQEATDPMQQSFAGLMRCYAKGDAIDMRETLRAFPVELTSVDSYARNVLAAG
jgi:uncharacterized protein YbjT (DUF2867 family)